MSAQASKAARKLADKLRNTYVFEYGTDFVSINEAAAIIQSALADLLEMLNQQTCSATNCGHADCEKIREALKPWKPEK